MWVGGVEDTGVFEHPRIVAGTSMSAAPDGRSSAPGNLPRPSLSTGKWARPAGTATAVATGNNTFPLVVAAGRRAEQVVDRFPLSSQWDGERSRRWIEANRQRGGD
jgi:hypothetical protein